MHAFPTTQYWDERMTLRDYFAANAMYAAFSEFVRQMGEGELAAFGWEGVAAVSYRIADAMLAERDKGCAGS